MAPGLAAAIIRSATILESPFYYGVFEYPLKSGNWYQGKHKSLITKELYDEVQKQLKGSELKSRQEKEFAFTKLMKCGPGICADEKHKKLKDGTINSHIYYGCTKVRDKNCRCGYISETELIKQLQALVDKVEVNELSVKKQIVAEVTRYKKFEASLLNQDLNFEVNDIDIKRYIKFLLKEGSTDEKRRVLLSFNTNILLSEKVVSVSNV